MNEQEKYHKSVLTNEVITYLNPKPKGVYVDATFGGGGHTEAILKAEPKAKIIAFDWDLNAIENGQGLKEIYGDRLTLIWSNFAMMTKHLHELKIDKVNGIIADFGTSQFQIYQRPGFSVYQDTKLDMRMSPGHQQITAQDIVNKASESELIKIFQEYGHETNAKKIARAIVEDRKSKPFKTTGELAGLIQRIVKDHKRNIHPATKVFQALRIVVNSELENIHALLKTSINLLGPEGRIVCITFHSLEDRIVKHFFKDNSQFFEILTTKVVEATEEETKQNPSSRSAKLRAAKKKQI